MTFKDIYYTVPIEDHLQVLDCLLLAAPGSASQTLLTVRNYFVRRIEVAFYGHVFDTSAKGLPAKHALQFLQSELENYRTIDTTKADVRKYFITCCLLTFIQERYIEFLSACEQNTRAQRRKDTCDICRDKPKYCKRCKKTAWTWVQIYERYIPDDTTDANVVVFYRHMPKYFQLLGESFAHFMLLCASPGKVNASWADWWEVESGSDLVFRHGSDCKRAENTHFGNRQNPQSMVNHVCASARTSRVFICSSIYSGGEYTNVEISRLPNNIRKLCQITLQKPTLDTFLASEIYSTQSLENLALASQADCPSTMEAHEYVEFGSLRSGGNLQMRNLARWLQAQLGNLDKVHSFAIFVQSLLQIGPISTEGL